MASSIAKMGEFARFAQKKMEEANWDTYVRTIRLTHRFLVEGDEALENAVGVSFLEHIAFDGPNGERAWEILSNEQKTGD